jgi:stage V sporulation protein D (sporulation-specific penicillin-binding protein)
LRRYGIKNLPVTVEIINAIKAAQNVHIPTVSSGLQKGGSIVLYTDSDSRSETISVPSLIGLSPDEVNSVASAYGLNVSFSGATTSSGTSSSQDIEVGTSVSPGTVITVSFADSSSTLNE